MRNVKESEFEAIGGGVVEGPDGSTCTDPKDTSSEQAKIEFDVQTH